MMNLSINNDPSLGFDISEPLVLAKPGSLSIDLADLLSLKTLKTTSSQSTNDSISIKADEETAKSIVCGELEFAPVNPDVLKEQKITIGDIISKRAYTKRSNDSKRATNTEKKKKRLANLDGDVEENIIKKEKLENGESKQIVVPMESPSIFPELVFKDGKVQMITPGLIDESQKVTRQLEVVHSGKKKVTTSTSFKQMTHTEKWTEKETEKFYRALKLFGTDFSMIAKVFKSRNRNQIKNKFLREERIAAEKVDRTLKDSKPSNFQTLFRKFEKLKKAQESFQLKPIAQENTEKESKTQNLLIPVQKPVLNQESKLDEIQIIPRDRNERSGSFHSTTSIDSMDRAIIEDLTDILMPQKTLFGL